MAKTNKKQETKRPRETWNAISGTMRIYGEEVETKKNSFIRYTASVSRKDGDGYVNYYLDCRFTKDAGDPDIVGEGFIEVENAFISLEQYTDKNGEKRKKPVIVIMEWGEI